MSPQRLRLNLGRALGVFLKKLAPKRVRIAETNISTCFAELSDAQKNELLEEHIQSIGQGVVEALMAWTFSQKKLNKLMEIEGQDELALALEISEKHQRPILLLGVHSTSIDLTPPFLSSIMTASGVYKPLRDKTLNKIILKGRLRHAECMFRQNDMRGMLAHLKKAKHLWYASDQDFGRVANGEFADLYGQPAHTLSLYAKMAMKTDAIVLPVGVFRQEKAEKPYLLRFLPIIPPEEYSTPIQAARVANRSVERLCMGFEAQYYWVHRRFKTQKDNKSFYCD